MRAVIVGGGVGGLSAAIALARVGLEVVVLERARALAPVGAGINLAANAMKALTALGADAHVRRTGVAGEQELYLDLATGERIARRQLLGEAAARRYGDVYHSVHRADLVDALVAQLPAGALRVDSYVEAIEQSPRGVRAVLRGGAVVEGDLLVGADGLNSRVRATLFGEDEPVFMGVQGWRTLFPRAGLPAHLPPAEGLSAWIGPGRTASMYPIRPDLMYGGAFVPASEVREESWTSEGGIEELRAAFRGACADVQAYIDTIESSAQTLFLTSLYYRDPLEHWSTERITLLGDAAHPGPPAAGQGAAMAMEDAVTLAGCIRTHGADLRTALREYEARRLPRTCRVVESALAIQRVVAESDPVRIAARNGRLRGLAQLDPLGEASFGWMAGHDVVDALDRDVEEVASPVAHENPPRRRPEARRAWEAWRGALTVDDRAQGWTGERAGYDRLLPSPLGASGAPDTRRVDADGVPALLVGEGDGPAAVHLHGGGFTAGSGEGAVPLARRLSALLDGPVLVPQYRLAPEHPFPAALDDAVTAYRWLRRERAHVALTGECAGGGLAVSAAVRLRDEDASPPTAIAVVSPFADLRPRTSERAGDGWFARDAVTVAAASYLYDHDPADPLASPVRATLTGLPPLLIAVAADEYLYPDARALAESARSAGVGVEWMSVDDSVHSFVLFPDLPEAEEAVARIAAFVCDAVVAART